MYVCLNTGNIRYHNKQNKCVRYCLKVTSERLYHVTPIALVLNLSFKRTQLKF